MCNVILVVWSVALCIHLLLCYQVEKSAFVVGDLGALMQQHVCWQSVVPQLQPYYPVKCNSSPAVIEVLAALGLGFVCANKVGFKLQTPIRVALHVYFFIPHRASSSYESAWPFGAIILWPINWLLVSWWSFQVMQHTRSTFWLFWWGFQTLLR